MRSKVKSLLKRIPRWLNRVIRMIYIHKSDRIVWRQLNKEIELAPGKKSTKAILREMSAFGNTYKEIIHEMCHSEIQLCKQREKTKLTVYDPIVICIVKNEIHRIKLFFDYYRNALGVKAFAFFDDNSTDGTQEYLLQQADVSLYISKDSYTSIRRVTWINRIIEAEGLKRWYLIVDADELFDYNGRDCKKIYQLTHFLDIHKQSRVKALMIDMFAPDRLFSAKLKDDYQIVQIYNRFFSEYSYKTENHIVGGGRTELFRLAHIESEGPCVTKYPLIHVDHYDFMINAHQYYPKERNKPITPNTVLRHYKFLPTDKEKYDERIKKGNFHHNSVEYRAYKLLEDDEVYSMFIRKTEKYREYSSLTSIQVLTELCFDGERFVSEC